MDRISEAMQRRGMDPNKYRALQRPDLTLTPSSRSAATPPTGTFTSQQLRFTSQNCNSLTEYLISTTASWYPCGKPAGYALEKSTINPSGTLRTHHLSLPRVPISLPRRLNLNKPELLVRQISALLISKSPKHQSVRPQPPSQPLVFRPRPSPWKTTMIPF